MDYRVRSMCIVNSEEGRGIWDADTRGWSEGLEKLHLSSMKE